MKKNLGAGCIAYPTPTYIVATYNEDGSCDVMNAAWGGLCASKPPCVEIALNTGRRTRENILRTNAFTINLCGQDKMEECDYFGLVSGAKEDKLAKVGYTTTKSEFVNAPVIDAFPLTIECEVYDTKEIGPHLMVIGEIKNVLADESILNEKGQVDIEKLKPFGYDPVGNKYVAFDKVIGDAFGAGLKILKG